MDIKMFWFVFLNCFTYGLGVCQHGVYEWGVNKNEINEIVNVHNSLRVQIARGQVPNQPQGANLIQMYWDNNLARAAQNIANTCQYEHQSVTDNRFEVGQNIYTWMSTEFFPGANWTSAIYSWFNEYQSYKFNNQNYNHYTQVVWESTYLIGCGYTYYPSDGWYQKFYVCNYGPAGNYIGQYPYEVGHGCTNLCNPAKY